MRAALAALAVLPLLFAVQPARAAVPSGNLLTNPGAEAAPGDPDELNPVHPPPGWIAEGRLTALNYGVPTYPSLADAQALGGGTNLFTGGNTGVSAAIQAVDVSAAAPEIDRGVVVASLSALLGGYATQDDAATITLSALAADGAELDRDIMGPVTMADRGSQTMLLPRALSRAVPRGTRTLVVRMDMVRSQGVYNDGYVDNVALTLTDTTPQPVYHQSIVIDPLRGSVQVKLPGATTYVPISTVKRIPLGSIVDTRHGAITLTSVPKAGGRPETAKFYDGLFKIVQVGSVTELRLVEALARCPKRATASAAAVKKKPTSRRLWGEGSGSFRTRGAYSSATVRGTKWLVKDSCAGTTTRVVRGVVAVRDFRRHRTLALRAGKHYLARR